MPILTGIFLSDMLEEIVIMLHGILFPGQGSSTEVHVVGMRVERGHAAVPRDPIELLLPDPVILFL